MSMPSFRRSPRFVRHPIHTESPQIADNQLQNVGRQLNFNRIPEDSPTPASSNYLQCRVRTTRRVQLHPSLEPGQMHSSVDFNHINYNQTQNIPESQVIPNNDLLQSRNGSANALQDKKPSSPHENPECVNNEPGSPVIKAVTRGVTVMVDDEGPEGQIRDSRADEKSPLFAFLSQMNIRQLRSVLKDWQKKQSGNKSTLVARAFLQLQIIMMSGKTASEAMSAHRDTQRFESWLSHKVVLDQRPPFYIPKALRDNDLFQLLEVREVTSYKRQIIQIKRVREGLVPFPEEESTAGAVGNRMMNGRNEVEANVPDTQIFTVNEFARLCIIMRDDEDAKAALGGTGQELSRSQLDAGFTRDSYWGVIESRFNDPSLQLNLNMVGSIDDVDSTLPPPRHRSASFLKDKFFDARRSFTTRVENWSVSGQNDSGNLKKFAGTRNGELTAEGKRNMVMFVSSRKGTENEDTRFSSFVFKVNTL